MSAQRRCGICSHPDKEAPYKCPKCYILYCSLHCYKDHGKGAHCKPAEPTALPVPDPVTSNPIEPDIPLTEEEQEENKLTIEQLSRLDHSNEVREYLANKDIQQLVKHIATADPKTREQLLDEARATFPAFDEFTHLVLSTAHQDDSST